MLSSVFAQAVCLLAAVLFVYALVSFVQAFAFEALSVLATVSRLQ